MELEKNDYFIILKGKKLSPMPNFFMGMFGIDQSSVGTDVKEEVSYDHTFDGIVWKALSVCGQMVAAQCIFAPPGNNVRKVGEKDSLNIQDLEIWPVTQEYANALVNK